MMWRGVTSENLRGLQSVYLGGAMLLGIVLVVAFPDILSGSTRAVQYWGAALIAAGAVGSVGEYWINHGHSPKRWVLAFVGHAALTAIFIGLAVSSAFSIDMTHRGIALMDTIVFAQLAAVHRIFVYWRDDVPE